MGRGFVAALTAPEVRERIVASGSEVVASCPEGLAAFQEREIGKSLDLARDARIEQQ